MSQWPMVKLGEVLRHRKEFITIDDLTNYKRPRVQLHVKGIVLRDEVPGTLIKTKTQQVCRMGEFLVAEIDAKVGGFGIVPESLDGSIVSSHYFLFVIDEKKLDRSFLGFFIRTPAFCEQVAAQGSTNYAAIRPAHVLGYEIPLPPLAEQRRIVARIEELSAQIREASSLRQQTVEEVKALPHSFLSKLLRDEESRARWSLRPLVEIAEINPKRGKRQIQDNSEVSFVPMSAVSDKTGEIISMEMRTYAEVKSGYTQFEEGDIIFARITPCMQNGKSAIAKGLYNGIGFGSTEFHVIRPNLEIDAKWVHYLFRHREFLGDAAKHFTGTAGQQRVPASFMRKKTILVPPLPEQRRIVAELDALQAQVNALKRLQAETAAELDALLPAVLDRAFKGALS
ncbi:MAG: restriction endonuclease subunit S [Candidatus Accumulibacter sp.]|jgi:type I restriction enzyme S subunit|nr:restriction endonuclease subunit S [Accumulibacter sp.]